MKFNITIAALTLALPLAAVAGETTSGRAGQFMTQLENRFVEADANGDGRLSKEEAKAGMPKVYSNFEAIDADHDGYVTKDEILSALQHRMTARRAGQAGQR
jgi:Ca2+-binding EF-hand superfamily protein